MTGTSGHGPNGVHVGPAMLALAQSAPLEGLAPTLLLPVLSGIMASALPTVLLSCSAKLLEQISTMVPSLLQGLEVP